MCNLRGEIKMITLFNNKEECCGCTACKSVCPKQAITMEPDEDGFLYPVINRNLCIECRLCKRVCVFQIPQRADKKPIATYAAIHKDQEILKNSSSGGVFAALASIVLESKGIVFGCTMNENLESEHIKITSMTELRKIQGSKYVESNVKETFSEVKGYLQEGKKVLYTGTPCQIDGLKSYLKTDYSNLITADLICHGVPSNKFFKGYFNYLEKKNNAKVVDFKFRDKTKNGMSCVGKVTFSKKGKVYEKKLIYTLDYFYNYFMYGVISRESCYRCPYASSNRPADFTMGDYWGIEEAHSEIDTKNGVSVLLVNSSKGMSLLNKLNLELIESTFEKASVRNGNLLHPTQRSSNREAILKIFREEGAQAVAKNFQKSLGIKILLYKIKAMIPNSLKKKVNKIFAR